METQRTRALRVAAIGRTGRGDWGHAIDQLWQNRLDSKVVAVADDSPDGLTQACVRHGLEKNAGFLEWQRMIADVKPDVVVICMRHIDCHAEMAIHAAKSGAKGIFIEKPFVRTPDEAKAVIQACRKANTKLSIAFVNRHSESYLAARDLIEAGKIGRVLELRGRGKEDHRGGGEDLWVLGSHILDMMVDLGGEPHWCQATVTKNGQTITKEDFAEGPEGLGLIAGDSIAAMFGLADGPIGYFASIRDAGLKQPNFGLTVAGTKGAIHIWPDRIPHCYFRSAPLWRVDKDYSWQPIGPSGLGVDPTALDMNRTKERALWGKRAVSDLIDAINEDREPETGMYAGATTVKMISAIYASALSDSRKII